MLASILKLLHQVTEKCYTNKIKWRNLPRWCWCRTLQSPLPHTHTQLHHRPSHGPQPIQYSSQGSQQPPHDHQGGYVHPGTGPPIKQKPWKVPASPHMGPSTSGITNTFSTSQPTYHPTSQLLKPPYWFPTLQLLPHLSH